MRNVADPDSAAAFVGWLAIDMCFGHEVEGIELRGERVLVPLKDAADVEADALLYAGGRQGNTDGLGLDAIGRSARPHRAAAEL